MSVLDLLSQVREGWVTRMATILARGAGVRESFRVLLEQFFDAMQQALETGEQEWIEPVINEWAAAQTANALGEESFSVLPIISKIIVGTQTYLRETLSIEESQDMTEAMLPVFAHAYEHASKREMRVQVQNVQRELEIARDTLQQLDKSKSDFISVAAHELKTPLTLIEGYAAMIKDLASDDASPQTLYLKGIDNGTRRLREIVDDMIDVSLLDNDLLSLNFQPMWLNRIFSTLHDELIGTVEERRQTLDINDFPGCAEMTFGDPERLYQAFRNLLTNAIKYTPDGGLITVDGRLLPGFVEITIVDNGIGISPENHVLIFEKFGQLGNVSLHSSGKTKFMGGGPGLGLPITKGLIEAHGGTIWVESDGHDEETRPGAIFHVMLPMRREAPDQKINDLFRSLIEKK